MFKIKKNGKLLSAIIFLGFMQLPQNLNAVILSLATQTKIKETITSYKLQKKCSLAKALTLLLLYFTSPASATYANQSAEAEETCPLVTQRQEAGPLVLYEDVYQLAPIYPAGLGNPHSALQTLENDQQFQETLPWKFEKNDDNNNDELECENNPESSEQTWWQKKLGWLKSIKPW